MCCAISSAVKDKTCVPLFCCCLVRVLLLVLFFFLVSGAAKVLPLFSGIMLCRCCCSRSRCFDCENDNGLVSSRSLSTCLFFSRVVASSVTKRKIRKMCPSVPRFLFFFLVLLVDFRNEPPSKQASKNSHSTRFTRSLSRSCVRKSSGCFFLLRSWIKIVVRDSTWFGYGHDCVFSFGFAKERTSANPNRKNFRRWDECHLFWMHVVGKI